MTEPAAIRATYSEWKMVKTRKVLVLSFEVPLEHQAAVQAALGTPMPDEEVWVGIAKLSLKSVETTQRAKLATVAGILCNEGGFNAWAAEHGYADGKEYIYDRCSVTSRADLDRDPEAGGRFRDMRAEYDVWLRDAA